MGKRTLTYFEVKLAALILKKVALDSAATALAFKIRRVNVSLTSWFFLKQLHMITEVPDVWCDPQHQLEQVYTLFSQRTRKAFSSLWQEDTGQRKLKRQGKTYSISVRFCVWDHISLCSHGCAGIHCRLGWPWTQSYSPASASSVPPCL